MAGINSNASSGVIKRYIDAQDDKLQTNIDSEASARASADTTLQSNINKEASARLEGDNSLRTDLTAETNERKGADNTLQANINAEASTRAEQVGSLRADLTAETNARETADSALRTDVDTVTAGLSTETSERKTADSVLQGNIDAETTARTTKDGELESSIASEVTRAKNAESTLTTNLSAEVTRAKNAEQTNATAISNEASTRETNDNALSARIDVNAEDIAALKGRSIRYAVHLDSASPTQAQLTSAYQSASGSTAPPEDGTTLVDLNYNKEYTWFESSSTWVDRGSSTITPATNSSYGSVKGQTADGTVKADDGLLSVNGWSTVKNDISANAESISNEVSRATGAENTLQNNIDAEASARTSEDGKLNTAISNEVSRAKSAESTLQDNIDAETSARTSADTTLQANIDKKVTANTAITGGTFTKVTVDTKGLVTSGASLSASDIPTIAQSQVSGLTSALNGKQAVSNLVTAWQTTPDNTHYPSEKLVSDSITSEATARSESDATLQANINKKVTANANITAGTNCKITYDAKGLVTAGTSLSASDIPTIPESKVSNLVNDLAGKQAKLTAGDYISIGTDNTISHSSSGAVAGTYGNSGFAPKITVDGFGHITSVEDVSISADVANSLSTAGTIKVNLASSSAPTYTSGGNISPGVTGVLPVANGGTGNSSVDTVPTANSTKMVTSGGVASALAGKQDELTPGANITISGTTISAKDTTYGVATASANGLMSSTDKSKLDGIEAGAQKNTVTGVKGSSETAYRTGNVSISKTNIGLGNVDNTADSSKVVKGASEDGSGNVITDSYVASGSASGQTVTLLSKSGDTLATFTTQDSNVKQTNTTSDTAYPILLKNGTGTGEITSTTLFNSGITITPSTKTITATTFSGNALTATTASKLGTNAGSSTIPVYFSGGKPVQCNTTLGVNISGNAATATKLEESVLITTNLESGSGSWFDGHEGISPGVYGVLPVANGGTGQSNLSSVTVGKATSATLLTTARAIDGVNFNGGAAVTHYGTCDTAAATAAKVVAITNFTLVTGARAIVKFTVTNTAANPTLNVNNTGAKAIQYRGAAITAGYLAANRTYEFVYDGTNYQLVGDINTDTNTDTKVTQTNSTAATAYPILLKNGTGTGTVTNGVLFDDGVTITPSTGLVTATTFKGALTGNVTGNCSGSSGSCTGNAATATKLGTASVGSATQPIYLNAGTATATTSTVGGTSKPMYLKAGVMTAISDTVGGVAKPVYLNAGTITACSQTVGSSTGPVYMNAGTITACGSLATSTSPQPQAVSASVGSETTKYARGDHRHPAYLSRHTVTIKSTTLYQMISISASDYVANGRGAHMKIECICTSTVNTKVRHTFTADIMWSGANVECWIPNSLPSTNANSGVYQIRCLAPKSDSYGCSVDVRGYDANARIIDLRILESDCPYTVITAPSTNLYNSSHYNYAQYDIGRQNWFFTSNPYAGDCTGRSGSTWDTFWNDRFKIGEATVVGALCALAQDGAVYRLTNKTVKFKLPMIMGRCNNVYATTQTYGALASNLRGILLSELANQGFTVPTYAIGDNLYLQGTLDGVYFKSDGIITTSMATKGKTYIMFGKVEYLNSTTATHYTLTSYGVEAYTTSSADATKINYIDGRKVVLADNAGSSTRPVYFSNGIPVQCGTSLGVSVTGNAATATQLQTARNIQTNLASTTAASFNGTANVSPGVTGILPVAHGGTGQSNLSNVTVGRATADGSGNNIESTYVKSVSKYFFNVIAKNMSYVDPCVLNYVRITPKSGLLSGFVHLKSGSSSNWAVLLISELSTAFGLSFITPTTQRVCGKWVYGDGDSHGDRYGYSATLSVNNEGYIGFGRIYDLAGTYGGWEQSSLGNQRYLVFDSVYLEEN